MSGATKGYRYVTGRGGVTVTRHHALAAAYVSARQNKTLVYRLARPLPILTGDAIPPNAEPRPLPPGRIRYR